LNIEVNKYQSQMVSSSKCKYTGNEKRPKKEAHGVHKKGTNVREKRKVQRITSSYDIPNLVRVTSCAMKHLDLIPRGDTAIGKIKTLMLVRPSNPSIGRDRELLVRVPSGASKDLHLSAVGRAAVCHVETFVTEDDEGATGGGPCLGSRAITRLYDDGSIVSIRACSQTGCGTRSGMNDVTGRLR